KIRWQRGTVEMIMTQLPCTSMSCDASTTVPTRSELAQWHTGRTCVKLAGARQPIFHAHFHHPPAGFLALASTAPTCTTCPERVPAAFLFARPVCNLTVEKGGFGPFSRGGMRDDGGDVLGRGRAWCRRGRADGSHSRGGAGTPRPAARKEPQAW